MAFLLDELLSGDGVKTVGMCGHVRPDGDAIGAALGVYNYIKLYYPRIEPTVFLENVPEIFHFMKGSDEVSWGNTGQTFDLFIVLDCGDRKRLGDAGQYFDTAKKTVCIDHHESNDSFADVNYIKPHASATCELICGLIDETRINQEIAACLYTGIVTDTGVFQYDATSPETLAIAGKLIATGIPFSEIIERTFFEKTFSQNRIMGQALIKAKLHEGGKVISSYITREEETSFGAVSSDYEGIAEQLRNTAGVVVSIFLHELKRGEFKASTRASGDINLAELAVEYGGGGHAKAAGFTVTGEPDAIVEELVGKVASRL